MPPAGHGRDDFAQRLRARARAQFQGDVFLFEKIGKHDSHDGVPEESVDYPGKASYPVIDSTVATENTPPESTTERTVSLQRSIYDPGYVNAMSHFYRGELGRIMVWRQRLDITTNWAITSSTAIITIAFSNRGRAAHHLLF